MAVNFSNPYRHLLHYQYALREIQRVARRLRWPAKPATVHNVQMHYEWDLSKAAANRQKHGVSFDEAASVFLDSLAISGPDPDSSIGERRYITFGHSSLGRLIAVFHTYRTGKIRIISARRTTRAERKLYEEG